MDFDIAPSVHAVDEIYRQLLGTRAAAAGTEAGAR